MSAGHSAEQHSRYLLQPTDTFAELEPFYSVRFRTTIMHASKCGYSTPVPEQTNYLYSNTVITGNNIRLGNAWGPWGVGGVPVFV